MVSGERIRACRQRAGMSQEMAAELVGVSRQAVAKWESGKSAPSTENLFRLAEVLGTTPQSLLDTAKAPAPGKGEGPAPASPDWRQRLRDRLTAAGIAALGYMAVYLTGRLLWCGGAGVSVLGWLFQNEPAGPGSYLFGWLLHGGLFWWAMALSVVWAVLGKTRLAGVSLLYFVAGFVLGVLLGPNPAGVAIGQDDYGWAIWAVACLTALPVGALAERAKGRGAALTAQRGRRYLLAMGAVTAVAAVLAAALIP